jgi:hypothetical protein
MIGPGRYDDVAIKVREDTGAKMVCVCIAGGILGSGFSVQCADPVMLHRLPYVLRQVADQVEKDLRG